MLEKAFFQTALVGENLRNIFLLSQRGEIFYNYQYAITSISFWLLSLEYTGYFHWRKNSEAISRKLNEISYV